MGASRDQRVTHGLRAVVAKVTILALGVASLAGVTAAPASAAAATVGNGLATTDLAAVGMSPTSLASALVGPGVTVSNVTYTGANAQAGLVHLVDPAVVSFNDGVILSSGNIADVVGPNKSDGITGDMAGPADADLTALIAASQTVNPMTYDAAVLEFDFVPAASPVYFTYTFGSDEYLEWVNLFNDVFAFYVNGTNCATVPPGDPVSIDTINSTVNPQLFRDNSFSSPPANPINIESDGLTVEMICEAAVNPGVTNHMKLAIADTSDQILDSVVVIKSGTLSTTKPESCNDAVDNDDDTLVDMDDDYCTSTTTPAPPGNPGIGIGGNPPPFTGNEGTPIPLVASSLGWAATPDTLTTSWTVTGINGTPGTCDVTPSGPLPLEGDSSIAVVTTTCPNEGEYVASVHGWDVEAHSSFDFDVDFFVHNAPPAVTIDAPLAGAQPILGATVPMSATVEDPGVDDVVTCEIDWGDGTTEPGTLTAGTCTGSHAFSSLGTKLLSVTATDDFGDTGAAAAIVEVVPVPICGPSGVGPFDDVAGTHPFCDDIDWMATSGIAGGYPDGGFHPIGVVSRQAMGAFLHRYAGEPAVTLTEPFFADVAASSPFYDAIQWMAETGLSTGTPHLPGLPTYGPGASVSRQAMAAFLYRYAGEPAVTLTEPFFADVAASSPFYDAVQWMAETGLSTGTPQTAGKPLYKPVSSVTRQAMAAFLHRYDAL